MPLLNSLATPYADALLQIGEGRQETDQLAEEAKALLAAWLGSPELQAAMASPVLQIEAKKKALQALFGAQVSPTMLNLLKLLADRQRIGVLDAILLRFLELYRELRGITLAHVTSISRGVLVIPRSAHLATYLAARQNAQHCCCPPALTIKPFENSIRTIAPRPLSISEGQH
jgi:ATP synthase F1 delta subunit